MVTNGYKPCNLVTGHQPITGQLTGWLLWSIAKTGLKFIKSIWNIKVTPRPHISYYQDGQGTTDYLQRWDDIDKWENWGNEEAEEGAGWVQGSCANTLREQQQEFNSIG